MSHPLVLKSRDKAREYDAFEHLCASIFISKRDLVAMITAYFDDSGTHGGSPVVTVAGYASDKLRWDAFNRDWRRLLRREKIKVVHMADLESSWGEFKGWDKERRETLIQSASEIIGRRTRMAVGCAVIKADWDRAMPEYLKEMFGGPFGWCASECIRRVSMWAKQNDTGRVRFVFEGGTDGQGEIGEFFREIMRDHEINKYYGVDGYSFENKSVLPLHPADMLAYEVNKEMQNSVVKRTNRKVRYPLNALIGRHNPELKNFGYWNAKQLKDWVEWAEKHYGGV